MARRDRGRRGNAEVEVEVEVVVPVMGLRGREGVLVRKNEAGMIFLIGTIVDRHR